MDDVPNSTLDANTALAIIRAMYPGEKSPNPANSRDVYVSASWHEGDNKSANAVCKFLVDQGFRLIGDSPDQQGFGSGSRPEEIMSSCGAFVSIIPFRGEEKAIPGEKPYKYFLQEIESATELGLPSIVIADPRVSHAGGVFCAMDLDSEDTQFTGPIRQIVQLITSMPTKIGNEVHEGNPMNVNAAVRHAVCDAFLVIADLTDDNLNTCIEAGMALAVGKSIELLAAGPQRRPPFMLRERHMPTYMDRVQQIGLVHKLSRPYRRRVINAEL